LLVINNLTLKCSAKPEDILCSPCFHGSDLKMCFILEKIAQVFLGLLGLEQHFVRNLPIKREYFSVRAIITVFLTKMGFFDLELDV